MANQKSSAPDLDEETWHERLDGLEAAEDRATFAEARAARAEGLAMRVDHDARLLDDLLECRVALLAANARAERAEALAARLSRAPAAAATSPAPGAENAPAARTGAQAGLLAYAAQRDRAEVLMVARLVDLRLAREAEMSAELRRTRRTARGRVRRLAERIRVLREAFDDVAQQPRVPFDDLRWRTGRIKRAPLSADQKASQAARLAEIRKRLSANQAAEPSRGLPGETSDQSSTEEA